MGQKRNMRLLVIFFIIGIITTGAYLAIARDSFTSACEGCHTDTATLNIWTNATGEACTARWTVPFVLVVYADGYSAGDNEFVISLHDIWADNDEFTFTEDYINDGDGDDLDADTNEITVAFTITPNSMGTFTFRIYTGSAGNLCNWVDVTITVIHWDIVAPIIDNPDDKLSLEGDSSANVTWTPTEANPDRYEVLDGVSTLESGAWDGSPIETMLGSLGLGVHTLTVTVWDIADTSVSDVVDVTVYDGTAPVIPEVIDFSIPEGDTGNFIIWEPYDLHPSSYEIYENDTVLRTGLWNSSSEDISTSIDGYDLGWVNYTLVVYDGVGITDTDDVIISIIDGTPPIVDAPDDIAYLENSPDYKITWTFSDLHPISYVVYFGLDVLQSGAWNETIDSVTIDVGGKVAGTYNYTIELLDLGGHTVSDNVQVVSFSATIPIIFVHPDIEMPEGSTGTEIIWKPLDLNPNSYIVFLDGFPLLFGSWNDSSEVIIVSLDGLGCDVYNFTLVVIDDDLNKASDQVWVTVIDGTPPEIPTISDIDYIEGDLEIHSIEWAPVDDNTDQYSIFLNDELYLQGSWNSSSEIFSIDVSYLSMGIYNYTLLVNDVGGNSVSSTVFVTITDETLPIFNNPTSISISDDFLEQPLTWSITEVNPDVYELYIDDILNRIGIWNSTHETLTIVVEGLTLGGYNYTVLVSDTSNNTASSTIWVEVIDNTAPIVDNPLDIHYDYAETGNTITWEIYDRNLVSYEVYDCGVLYASGELTLDSTSLEIEVNGLPAGSHNFTLIVYDINGNSVSDCVWVSVLPTASSGSEEPNETDEPTNIDNSTNPGPNAPMQFNPTMSEEIIAMFTGWLIGGVVVLSVFLIFSRPKK